MSYHKNILPSTQSVTAFGRMMIEMTRQYVEETYTKENGYEHDAKVRSFSFLKSFTNE